MQDNHFVAIRDRNLVIRLPFEHENALTIANMAIARTVPDISVMAHETDAPATTITSKTNRRPLEIHVITCTASASVPTIVVVSNALDNDPKGAIPLEMARLLDGIDSRAWRIHTARHLLWAAHLLVTEATGANHRPFADAFTDPHDTCPWLQDSRSGKRAPTQASDIARIVAKTDRLPKGDVRTKRRLDALLRRRVGQVHDSVEISARAASALMLTKGRADTARTLCAELSDATKEPGPNGTSSPGKRRAREATALCVASACVAHATQDASDVSRLMRGLPTRHRRDEELAGTSQ